VSLTIHARANGVARICVIASGHITTSPRAMKAAAALREAGYDVRVVFSSPSSRLVAADRAWVSSGGWVAGVYHFDRETHFPSYVAAGVRYHAARRTVAALGVEGRATGLLGTAVNRQFDGLVRAAAATRADFFYGCTVGGLTVAAEAARRTGRSYALDLEDFHSDENDPSEAADLTHRVVAEIERRVLSRAAFLTCGSDAMASAYEAKYGIRPVTINNVFPLPAEAPDFTVAPGNLRVFWISQTVGPSRGLEDAIHALRLADRPATLTLRGHASGDYLDHLRTLAGGASSLTLRHEPADMVRPVVDLCRGHDVGLALEQAHTLNRRVCLSNKGFSYMLAGLAVIFTDTEGQRPLAEDIGAESRLVPVGDVERMAECFREWADDPARLEADRRAAWAAAVRRWHWEHPEEKGKLVGLFRSKVPTG
jgi:glycosyltransferase involved in cell wall biosynthesis